MLLNVEDYRAKMNSILRDESKFQKLGEIRDPTERNEKQLCEFLKSSRDKNIILAAIFEKLKPTGSHIPSQKCELVLNLSHTRNFRILI